MTKPQGATVTRETNAAPIRLRLWWHGMKEQPSVELSAQAAFNLAIDLLLTARHGLSEPRPADPGN